MRFKNTVLLSFLVLSSAFYTSIQAAEAWKCLYEKDGESITRLLLFSGDYFSWTEYKTDSGAFLFTKGGAWSTDKNMLELHFEFHSDTPDVVGQTERWKMKKKGETMRLQQKNKTSNAKEKTKSTKLSSWERVEAEESTALTNPWLFSGRERNGELSRRDTNQPRKTMKILTNKYFQWIAYNTETKEFFGTGGGEYEAKDGKYIEKIQFFSRDDNRVGAELEFSFDAKGDEWHHRGFSSSGDPMYEIWSKRTN